MHKDGDSVGCRFGSGLRPVGRCASFSRRIGIVRGASQPSLTTLPRTSNTVSTIFGPNYGDTLSWTAAEAPGVGERAVEVVFDVNVPKFERMALDMLMAPTPTH